MESGNDRKIELEVKREERLYDLTKYLASTSLTLVGVLAAAKQGKWIEESKIDTVFFSMLGLLTLVFDLLIYSAIYMTQNGVSKKMEKFILFNGTCIVAAVIGTLLKVV